MAKRTKSSNKLKLSKETLKNLKEAELDLVFGGSDAGYSNCTGGGPGTCCSCGMYFGTMTYAP